MKTNDVLFSSLSSSSTIRNSNSHNRSKTVEKKKTTEKKGKEKMYRAFLGRGRAKITARQESIVIIFEKVCNPKQLN